MRLMFIISAVVIALVQGVAIPAFSTPGRQAREDKKVSRVRRIQVNVETIAQLVNGKKYVVDLTQGSVIYELDSKTRQIDFSRMMVRTATGEVPMNSWLEKNFSKTRMAGWSSRRLIIGTTEAFRSLGVPPKPIQAPPTGAMSFTCLPGLCYCQGGADCNRMFKAGVCGPYAACDVDTGYCACLSPII